MSTFKWKIERKYRQQKNKYLEIKWANQVSNTCKQQIKINKKYSKFIIIKINKMRKVKRKWQDQKTSPWQKKGM